MYGITSLNIGVAGSEFIALYTYPNVLHQTYFTVNIYRTELIYQTISTMYTNQATLIK